MPMTSTQIFKLLTLVLVSTVFVSCSSEPIFVEVSGVPGEIRYRENIEMSFSTKPGSFCRADATGSLKVGREHMANPFLSDGRYVTWSPNEEDTLADGDSGKRTHLLEILGEITGEGRGGNVGTVTIACKTDSESAQTSFSVAVKPRVP